MRYSTITKRGVPCSTINEIKLEPKSNKSADKETEEEKQILKEGYSEHPKVKTY
jgi:hypothetical protein